MIASLSGLEASPRNGFFIEGGFETGMLESEERIKRNQVISRPMLSAPLLSNKQLSSDQKSVFSKTKLSDTSNNFSTMHLIKSVLTMNGIELSNYLPYTLNGLNLVARPRNGDKPIVLATLESLKDFSKTTLDVSQFDFINSKIDSNDLKTYLNNITKFNSEYELELVPSQIADSITKRVVDSLGQIKVDIPLGFSDKGFTSDTKPNGQSVYAPITQKDAQEYAEMFANLAYVLSSNTWEQAILKAPFVFSNSSSVGLNGQLVSSGETIAPQTIIDKFQAPRNQTLYLSILDASNFSGLSTTLSLSMRAEYLNPDYVKILKDPNLISDANERFNLEVFLHEYSHTKGYDSDHKAGNMTYSNVPENPNPTPSCPQGDYCINNKGVIPGFVGVSAQAWTTLAKENKLPINYNELSNQQPFNLMLSALKTQLNEVTTSINNKNARSATLGFNFKLGYQQYFNNYFGLSYYGIVKYNYAKANNFAKKINQVGLGIGVEALLDFTKNFGIFSGFRGLYNRYSLLNQNKNTGNIEFVGGINFWGKKSKYSIGVSLPLIQRNMKVAFNNPNAYGHVILKEGVSHFNVFFNYGWVF